MVWKKLLSKWSSVAGVSVLWLYLAGTVWGATSVESSGPLYFRRITTEHGLPGAEILCIRQDSRGFMWFGTSEGLARYDGRKFRIFRHARDNSSSIADNVVRDILEDKERNLWVATDGGLDYWDRKSEQFNHNKSNPASPSHLNCPYVRKLVSDPDGTLWVATLGGGLNHLDPRTGQWEHFLQRDQDTNGPSGNWMISLLRDHQGKIWIGTETGGLNEFDPKSKQFRVFQHDPQNPRSLSNDRVTGIAEDQEGYLWVSTDWGLSRLNPERTEFQRFLFEQTGPRIIMPPRIESVMVDAQGRVWAGTISGGLLRYDESTQSFDHFRQEISDRGSLVSDHVTSLFTDRSGGLWVGHYPSGISYADQRQSFRHFHAIPGQTNTLSKNSVLAFWEDARSNLWVGTDGGGLSCLNRSSGEWSVHRHDYLNTNTLGGNEILSLYQDSQDRFWVGTWNDGLDLFDPSSGLARHYVHNPQQPHSLSHARAWRILEDSQHQLWIATIGGGINRYVPEIDGFVHYRHDPNNSESLNHDNVWSLLVTRNGELWAGTSAGLGRFIPSSNSWRRYTHQTNLLNSLSHNLVVDLLEDRSGDLWIATYGGGLNQLNPVTGAFKDFGMKDGLPSDVVTAVIEDNDGILWISTINGLARLNPQTGQISTYDESNGLPGRHFSRNARLRLRSGELVFGGQQGFTLFHPHQIELNTNPPPVVLTRFEVFNEPAVPGAPHSPLKESISETTLLEIPARFSVISFEFAALNYQAPEKNQYAFKMHGFDKDWRKAGPERRATYTNLDPGKYRFQVIASNNEGVWNQIGTSLELIVIPPWWQTRTFQAAIFFGFVGLLTVSVRTVSHSRLKKQLFVSEQKRLLAEERKRAQEERLEMERKMMEVQKLESLGVLAGGIAHDFNNLLMIIMGHTSLAIDELPPSHPMRSSLDEIQNSAQRAADLCFKMLAYAGKGIVRMENLDLISLVHGMIDLVKSSISKKAVLKLQLASDLPPIRGDAGQIRHVVANLIINASEALEDAPGNIQVSVGAHRFTPSDLEQPYLDYQFSEGIYVWLEVADTGCGMEVETQRRIFEPFFTTKFMGRGLGLSAVLGIVRRHKGSISVQSEPGKGSIFRVYFPAVDAGYQRQDESLDVTSNHKLLPGVKRSP